MLYVGYVVIVSFVKPHWAPALPLEARTLHGFEAGAACLYAAAAAAADLPGARHDLPWHRHADRGRRHGCDRRAGLAILRKRLTLKLLKQAMESTAKLSTFVVFILIGARVFSLTFYGVDGHLWVEHLLTQPAGRQIGFLIVVNILVFLLAFFLDYFELPPSHQPG
jgi:TRAP-type mannitol/chloroaromatic compound transport system permease large subunit